MADNPMKLFLLLTVLSCFSSSSAMLFTREDLKSGMAITRNKKLLIGGGTRIEYCLIAGDPQERYVISQSISRNRTIGYSHRKDKLQGKTVYITERDAITNQDVQENEALFNKAKQLFLTKMNALAKRARK